MKMDRKLMEIGMGCCSHVENGFKPFISKKKTKKEIKEWNGIGCKLMEGGKEWKVGAPPVAPLC